MTLINLAVPLRRICILAALSFFAFLATPPSQAAVFNPETFTLDNGMQVVVISNHRVPVVTQMVWYKVGSADEGPGESGIAHVLEHLMFKGTPKFPNGTFSDTLAKHGGQENAFTSYDYTAYHQTVARDRLEMIMEMEADRMTNLILSDEDVLPERDVVLEERRSRTENNPSALLREQIQASLFLNHPYRRPVIGWEHEIKALNRKTILSFYKRWYAPNNAILVIAGDITVQELKPLAEKYYGVIAQADTPARNRPTEPPQRAERRINYYDQRVTEPSWQRVYQAPSYQYGAMKHAYSLEILADVLGGGATSRLYRALVIDQKVALNAGAYYSPEHLGPGKFGLYASPRPGIDMAILEAALLKEIVSITTDGVTANEVSRAQRTMEASAIYARDSLSTGARVLGAALSINRTIGDVENWPEHMASVTPESVLEAAKAVFIDEHAVTAQLLPKTKEVEVTP